MNRPDHKPYRPKTKLTLIYCKHCGIAFKPKNYKSKYCSTKCQCLGRRGPTQSTEKKCGRCHTVKAASEFGFSRTARNGLGARCKDCEKNRRRAARVSVEYRCDMCQEVRWRFKLYKNGELNRRTICCECAKKKAMEANGGRPHNYTGTKHIPGRLIQGWQFSAAKRNYEWHLTDAMLENQFEKQKGLCALSGLEMDWRSRTPYRLSLDRIDSKLHYTEDNIQLVCSIVNVMKNKIDEQEFVRMCGLIHNHRKSSK